MNCSRFFPTLTEVNTTPSRMDFQESMTSSPSSSNQACLHAVGLPDSSRPVARTATSIARTLIAANIAVISTPLNPSKIARIREMPSFGTSSP